MKTQKQLTILNIKAVTFTNTEQKVGHKLDLKVKWAEGGKYQIFFGD